MNNYGGKRVKRDEREGERGSKEEETEGGSREERIYGRTWGTNEEELSIRKVLGKRDGKAQRGRRGGEEKKKGKKRVRRKNGCRSIGQ